VLRKHLGLIAEDLDVEEVGLVRPVVGVVFLSTVDCQAHLENCGSRRKMPELGVAGEAPNERNAIDVACHLYSSS